MIQRIVAVSLIYAVVAMAGFVFAQGDRMDVDRGADSDKMLRIENVLRKQDTKIVFYGKVLDQDDQSVEGATVEIQVTQFSPNVNLLFGRVKSVYVKTDAEGSFLLKGEKGRSIYVKSVLRAGYEYIRSQNPNNAFDYSVREGLVQTPFVPQENAPVVFRLRRRGEETFCLDVQYWSAHVYAKESGRPTGYDFIRRTALSDLTKPLLNGEPLICDFKLQATLNTNDETWVVALSSGSGSADGGIIVSDELLYEAPDAGYQAEYIFTSEDWRPMKARYVYLKSRDPAIFTRIEIEHINANKEFFRMIGKSVTNPYGDRNLEQTADLPYELTQQLTDEIRAAFRENKRPSRPDLSILVKEAKERADEGGP